MLTLTQTLTVNRTFTLHALILILDGHRCTDLDRDPENKPDLDPCDENDNNLDRNETLTLTLTLPLNVILKLTLTLNLTLMLDADLDGKPLFNTDPAP